MSPVVGRESITSYGAAPRRWTDEYLEHGVACDLISRKRITRDHLVVLDEERLGIRCGETEECGKSGGRHGPDRQARSDSARHGHWNLLLGGFAWTRLRKRGLYTEDSLIATNSTKLAATAIRQRAVIRSVWIRRLARSRCQIEGQRSIVDATSRILRFKP